LLADEATSGLDPEATESILALLKRLRDEFGLSIILITHEMDAVRDVADNVALIQAGRIVEQGGIRQLLADPQSGIGRQLLPVRPLIRHQRDEWLLELTYGAGREVPADWISQLGQHWQARISLLGGSIEQVEGRLSGRVIVAVRFARDDPGGLGQISAYPARLGLNAIVLRQPQTLVLATEAAA
jgi:D-methionine transport system ATP-binding protein